MSRITIINKLLAKLGYAVTKTSPHQAVGSNGAFLSQKRMLSHIKNPVIFDVGANVGQVTAIYRHLFPVADIFAFEPSPTPLAKLRETFRDDSKVHIVNKCLGCKVGSTLFHLNQNLETSSLLSTHKEGPRNWGSIVTTTSSITVEILTLDSFAQHENIDHIDILKLDIQGAEYQALQGAQNMFASKGISHVFLEILTSPTYTDQPSPGEIIRYLETLGMELRGLYNLNYSREGKLRQFDAIFSHPAAVEALPCVPPVSK